MQLSDGDPARHDDVWLRIITNERHITKSGLHYAALKGAFKPPKVNRPWSSEASGRLRSLCGAPEEIASQATDYCNKLGGGQKFVGLMFASVGVINDQLPPDHSTSVHYTPITQGKFEDAAHADLTVAGPPIAAKSEQEEDLLQFLHGKFKIVHPYQMDFLPPAAQPTLVEPLPPEKATPTLVGYLSGIVRMIGQFFSRR